MRHLWLFETLHVHFTSFDQKYFFKILRTLCVHVLRTNLPCLTNNVSEALSQCLPMKFIHITVSSVGAHTLSSLGKMAFLGLPPGAVLSTPAILHMSWIASHHIKSVFWSVLVIRMSLAFLSPNRALVTTLFEGRLRNDSGKNKVKVVLHTHCHLSAVYTFHFQFTATAGWPLTKALDVGLLHHSISCAMQKPNLRKFCLFFDKWHFRGTIPMPWRSWLNKYLRGHLRSESTFSGQKDILYWCCSGAV